MLIKTFLAYVLSLDPSHSSHVLSDINFASSFLIYSESVSLNLLSVDGITSGSRVQEVAMRRADDMFNKLDSLGSLAKTSEPSFADRFVDSLNSVAEAQNTSKTMTQNYELGKENDLAKVMVAQQVSSLGFQLALNFRNKALSAYKDILNMPV